MVSLFQQLAESKQAEIVRIQPILSSVQTKSDNFNKAYKNLQRAQRNAGQIVDLLQDRYYWGDFLAQMRTALITAEGQIEKKMSAQKPGVEVGVWIEKMSSSADLAGSAAPNGGGPAVVPQIAYAMPGPSPVPGYPPPTQIPAARPRPRR